MFLKTYLVLELMVTTLVGLLILASALDFYFQSKSFLINFDSDS